MDDFPDRSLKTSVVNREPVENRWKEILDNEIPGSATRTLNKRKEDMKRKFKGKITKSDQGLT